MKYHPNLSSLVRSAQQFALRINSLRFVPSTRTNRLLAVGCTTTLLMQLALAGCAHVPTRQSTEEMVSRSSPEVESGVLELPEPLHMVPPVYPWEMKRTGHTGTVILSFVIDESGSMQNLTVADSSHREFIDPALEAFRKWTFKPARRAGVPVAMRATIPIQFALEP